jgi:hypothetical protein
MRPLLFSFSSLTMNPPPAQILIVQTQNSPMLAAVLGFFFGPIGLLYVGLVPALVMLGVNVLVAAFSLGFGLIFTWPLCAMVGWSRANLHNKKLLASAGVRAS